MELLTTSILTLLALYIIYSEPFKLPAIVKKNKNLVYILIIGLYLYYLQNNNVEGGRGAVEGLGKQPSEGAKVESTVVAVMLVCCFCGLLCSDLQKRNR